MRIDEPILTSMLDDDLYKITTAAVVFHNFPNVIARYEFINRGNTKFPVGFDEELLRQIRLMEFLALTQYEFNWMMQELKFLPPTFIEWLRGYRLHGSEVQISQVDGKLRIEIQGPWYRTIFWEVKLMSVISELYFRLTKHNMDAKWEKRIINKAKNLSGSECHWMEFGTRRRYSFPVQDRVVDVMRGYNGFVGTSNPYLAFKYDVPVKGTFPHEAIMAMSAAYGIIDAPARWLALWHEYYASNLQIALTDTFTTDAFLQTTPPVIISLLDGFRQDSGDPEVWADKKILPYYQKWGVNPKFKTLVFSDGLTDKTYKRLDMKYRKVTKPVGGIGTAFTNDVGATPLNMVIKMTGADFHNGDGMKNIVKLSDTPGKHSGNNEAVKIAEKTVSRFAS